MRYKIYEMVKPLHIQKSEPDGYQLKHIDRMALEVPEYHTRLNNDYNNIEDAEKAIIENKECVKMKDLCVLPVFSIDWNGDIT
jgi:hypothetical protein